MTLTRREIHFVSKMDNMLMLLTCLHPGVNNFRPRTEKSRRKLYAAAKKCSEEEMNARYKQLLCTRFDYTIVVAIKLRNCEIARYDTRHSNNDCTLVSAKKKPTDRLRPSLRSQSCVLKKH